MKILWRFSFVQVILTCFVILEMFCFSSRYNFFTCQFLQEHKNKSSSLNSTCFNTRRISWLPHSQRFTTVSSAFSRHLPTDISPFLPSPSPSSCVFFSSHILTHSGKVTDESFLFDSRRRCEISLEHNKRLLKLEQRRVRKAVGVKSWKKWKSNGDDG